MQIEHCVFWACYSYPYADYVAYESSYKDGRCIYAVAKLGTVRGEEQINL